MPLPEVRNYTPEERKLVSKDLGVPEDIALGMSNRQFASTYDDEYIKANPYNAGVDAYKHPSQMSIGNYLNQGLRSKDITFGNVLNKWHQNPWSSAGYSALAGMGVGAALNYILNKVRGQSGGYGTAVALGGGLAGLAGLGLGNQFRKTRGDFSKQAFFLGGDSSEEFVNRTLMQATDISFSEKQMLSNLLNRLGTHEMNDLKQRLLTFSGAGLGMVIARFIAGKGLLPLAVGGILGGMTGHAFGGITPTNAYGQYIY